MSRADVPIDATPTWHQWRRVGYTSEMADSDGQVWPTVHAVCMHCQEHREKVAVAWLEGTAGDIPQEVWPGKCNLGRRGPADTDWVSMATDPAPMGRTGRGLLRAVGNAMIWAFIAWVIVALLNRGDYPVWWWIPAWAVFGLGAGIYGATEDPSKKRPKKKG